MEGRNVGFTVAVTVWEDRVSPVFDAAQTLLIASIEGTGIVGRRYCHFTPNRLPQLVELLSAQGVSIVICGAISEEPVRVLEAAGFEMVSFVAGDCNEVLEAFIHSTPEWADLRMPGCGKNVCCQGRIRRGREIRPGRTMATAQSSEQCGQGKRAGGKRHRR